MATRFSRRREEKEGGREKTQVVAPPRAVFAHAPHHRDGGGEAHRTSHAPSEQRGRLLLASMCGTRQSFLNTHIHT